jgi:hypothetical protein
VNVEVDGPGGQQLAADFAYDSHAIGSRGRG